MQIFDLHCDTLYKVTLENNSIVTNNCHLSYDKLLKYNGYTQVVAIWIPDEYRGDGAVKLVDDCYNKLLTSLQQCKKINRVNNFNQLNNNHNVILDIEGGAALAGDINNVKKLRNMGVRFITLTWNGTNEIGDGIRSENPKGLTEFGKLVIPEIENNNIIIDISHASDQLFWQTAQLAKRPFVATHSNSRTICSNLRNLTDEQFKHIVNIGGIVGLNFYRYFITDNGIADFSDLEKHLYHFLSLGGENTVALGSDFDGAEMPQCITGVESMQTFYEYLLSKNYSQSLLEKLFYKNAFNFCSNYDKLYNEV